MATSRAPSPDRLTLTDGVGISRNKSSQFLGWFSVSCIIAQRMIGTGIFITPTVILQNDHNIGASILLWALGGLAAIAGAQLYLEYAMKLPVVRHSSTNERIHLPRSGGELVFLGYIFDTEKWNINWKFLVSCEFGIVFLLIGNSAANCISFAYHLLAACGRRTSSQSCSPKDTDTNANYGSGDEWIVTGIAIVAAVAVCCLHLFGRRFGIYLNNIFACLKGLILVLIILLGLISLIPDSGFKTHLSNLKGSDSFNEIPSQLNSKSNGLSFASSFLDITFTYGGWNQANYVLGEVDNPSKYFRKTTLWTVAFVTFLYLGTILSYMLVVEFDTNWNPCNGDYIITRFFGRTLGQHVQHTNTMAYIFLAFSSLGNVIVTTYTAARVKQEVAKEGVFFYLYSIYIVNSRISLKWLSKLKSTQLRPNNNGAGSSQQAETHRKEQGDGSFVPGPAPALILHAIFSVFLILIGRIMQPAAAYSTFLSIYSYLIDNLTVLILAIALIAMWGKGERSAWSKLGTGKTSYWSLISAAIVAITTSYVVVLLWAHNSGEDYESDGVAWFVIPVASAGLLGFAFLYWVLLLQYRRNVKRDSRFEATRDPDIWEIDGRYVQVSEKVVLRWTNKESNPQPME